MKIIVPFNVFTRSVNLSGGSVPDSLEKFVLKSEIS